MKVAAALPATHPRGCQPPPCLIGSRVECALNDSQEGFLYQSILLRLCCLHLEVSFPSPGPWLPLDPTCKFISHYSPSHTYFTLCSVTQSCLTVCDLMDCSPPGSICGIFQARILEWVAISFSRGSSEPWG